jgi:hypothetical protein
VPPLSSIISHPAEVFGIDRSAAPLSFIFRAVLRAVVARVVALLSAGAIVLWLCTVLGWLVVRFWAVIVLVVVVGDCVVVLWLFAALVVPWLFAALVARLVAALVVP